MSTGSSRRLARWLVALVAAFAAIVSGGVVAQAAPPYATEATITSIDFRQSTVESGELAQLDGAWSLPDNPTAPAGFVVNLPEGLQGYADDFPLLAPDGVTEMGQCTVTATQIICDIDSDYIADHPLNLSGTFNFWAEVTTEVTEDEEVTYDFDDTSTTVTVTPGDGSCPDCPFNGTSNYKQGTYDPETDTITWIVNVKAPVTGMVGGETVTIVDTPGPGQELLPGTRMRHANQIGTQPDGETGPIGWRAKPANSYTVSPDGATVTFTSEPGFFYRIVYTTRITDGGAAETYSNDADISVTGRRTVTVTDEEQRRGGGGTGSGDDVGRFSITKDVIWNSEPVDGLTFEGTFTVIDPEGEEFAGEFQVADGATWTSEQYPAGSVVHLEEIAPNGPYNLAWAEPVFSINDFAIADDTVTAVTLTNEATLELGRLGVKKELEGSGAGLVPTDATFILDYTYPAGQGFPAGSGQLVLPADGTTVWTDPLPASAVVTFTERTPAGVDGATWEIVPSPATLTVPCGDATSVHVITNTITENPPQNEPEQPEEPEQPVLASTGGALLAAPFIGGAILLIGVGIAAQVRQRTRSTR